MAEKSRLFILLAILFYPAFAYPSQFGDSIREIDLAGGKVFNFCTYTVKYKDGAEVESENLAGSYIGNAFFIEHSAQAHLLITNKHILKCATEKKDLPLPDSSLAGSVESFTAVSSLKIKLGAQFYKASLAAMRVNSEPDVDLAILVIDLPKNAQAHSHNLVSFNEGDYDLGGELLVRGFMPCGDDEYCDEDGWVRRLKFARVEGVTRDNVYVQISTAGYSGLSGSPVFIQKDGKFYVIGVFTIAWITNSYGSVDMSWAIRLKKEYFDPLSEVDKKP